MRISCSVSTPTTGLAGLPSLVRTRWLSRFLTSSICTSATVSDGGAVTTGLDMMRHTGASIGSRPVATLRRRSLSVTTPRGRLSPSTTMIEPTSRSLIRVAASRMGRSRPQVTREVVASRGWVSRSWKAMASGSLPAMASFSLMPAILRQSRPEARLAAI